MMDKILVGIVSGKADEHVSIELYISLPMITIAKGEERKMSLLMEILYLVIILSWLTSSMGFLDQSLRVGAHIINSRW
jgi:hypothetical protein